MGHVSLALKLCVAFGPLPWNGGLTQHGMNSVGSCQAQHDASTAHLAYVWRRRGGEAGVVV